MLPDTKHPSTAQEPIMDTNNNSKRIHPLIAGAAVSVMVASLAGVAAMTGLLPNSHGESKAVAEATPAAPVKAAQGKPAAVAKIAKPVASQQVALDEEGRPPVQPRRSDAVYRSPDYSQDMIRVAQPARICHDCGRVESVQAVQSQADPSGVGVVGGAVVGGLLGNQVGGGTGRTLATIAGAVGGGYAGNDVEIRTRTATTLQVWVRLVEGQFRYFRYNSEAYLREVDRVRVIDGYLQPAR
jgi:outer membrane lipoprotein SlyB